MVHYIKNFGNSIVLGAGGNSFMLEIKKIKNDRFSCKYIVYGHPRNVDVSSVTNHWSLFEESYFHPNKDTDKFWIDRINTNVTCTDKENFSESMICGCVEIESRKIDKVKVVASTTNYVDHIIIPEHDSMNISTYDDLEDFHTQEDLSKKMNHILDKVNRDDIGTWDDMIFMIPENTWVKITNVFQNPIYRYYPFIAENISVMDFESEESALHFVDNSGWGVTCFPECFVAV